MILIIIRATSLCIRGSRESVTGIRFAQKDGAGICLHFWTRVVSFFLRAIMMPSWSRHNCLWIKHKQEYLCMAIEKTRQQFLLELSLQLRVNNHNYLQSWYHLELNCGNTIFERHVIFVIVPCQSQYTDSHRFIFPMVASETKRSKCRISTSSPCCVLSSSIESPWVLHAPVLASISFRLSQPPPMSPSAGKTPSRFISFAPPSPRWRARASECRSLQSSPEESKKRKAESCKEGT